MKPRSGELKLWFNFWVVSDLERFRALQFDIGLGLTDLKMDRWAFFQRSLLSASLSFFNVVGGK